MSLFLACKDATALHTEYAEDALVGSTKVGYACHLVICARCRAYRRQLVTTASALQALAKPADEPKPDTVDDIMRRIAEGHVPDDE